MKLLIAGSRGYNNYVDFCIKMMKIMKKIDKSQVTIIKGGARGADRMARRYANDHDIPCITMLADWDKYGKQAGMLRNKEMADKCTHAVIFWDGNSPGTKHMISLLKEKGIKHVIMRITNNASSETENHKTSEGSTE